MKKSFLEISSVTLDRFFAEHRHRSDATRAHADRSPVIFLSGYGRDESETSRRAALEFVCIFGHDAVKEECLSKLILFGEKSLRHALREYVVYYHHERNHQGKENLLLFPASDQLPQSERKLRSRERLGGLLRFYHREAA